MTMVRTNRQITEESAKVIANNTLFYAQNAGNYIPLHSSSSYGSFSGTSSITPPAATYEKSCQSPFTVDSYSHTVKFGEPHLSKYLHRHF